MFRRLYTITFSLIIFLMYPQAIAFFSFKDGIGLVKGAIYIDPNSKEYFLVLNPKKRNMVSLKIVNQVSKETLFNVKNLNGLPVEVCASLQKSNESLIATIYKFRILSPLESQMQDVENIIYFGTKPTECKRHLQLDW